MKPKFTLNSFLKQFEKEAKGRTFELKHGDKLRAVDKITDKMSCGCPIDVAFCSFKTSVGGTKVNWVNADQPDVNFLSREVSDLILNAADGATTAKEKSLRKKLLKIAGVKE